MISLSDGLRARRAPIVKTLLISANVPPTVASDRANRSRRRITSAVARRRVNGG
jgi:hypothetical protein